MAEKEVEAKPRLARRGPGKLPTSRAASVDNQVIDRKNKQLNQATKQLEEKVKNLQEKSKARSLPRLAKVRKIQITTYHFFFKNLYWKKIRFLYQKLSNYVE